MAIKDLFKKTNTVSVENTVDPIIEARRREKFAKPQIFNDEPDVAPVAVEAKPVEKPMANEPAVKPAPTPATKPVVPASTPTRTSRSGMTPARPKVDSSYQFTEIISPMNGRVASKVDNSVTKPARKKPTQKPIEDQLVPVISPMYGASMMVEEEVEEVKEVTPTPRRSSRRSAPAKRPEPADTVTGELRNIASMIQEGDNELKLVEKRTGEFQFDFSNVHSEEPSLIDEIDDAMTLDELMSIYEKRFNDEEK